MGRPKLAFPVNVVLAAGFTKEDCAAIEKLADVQKTNKARLIRTAVLQYLERQSLENAAL